MLLTIIFALVSAGVTVGLGYWLGTSLGGYYAFFCFLIFPGTFLLLFAIWVLILSLWSLHLKQDYEAHHVDSLYFWVVKDTIYLLDILLNIHVRVNGKEKIPQGTRFVMVNNHVSSFDEFALLQSMPVPLVAVSKPENFRIPIAGGFLHHAGFIAINREDMKEGLKAIQQAIALLKREEANIEICPEGTRNKTDAALLSFHPGSFRIATESQHPLMIACIRGTKGISKKLVWHWNRVDIDILEVLAPEQYKDMTTGELSEYAFRKILDDLEGHGARA